MQGIQTLVKSPSLLGPAWIGGDEGDLMAFGMPAGEATAAAPVLRSGPLLLRPLAPDDEAAWRGIVDENRGALAEVGLDPGDDFDDLIAAGRTDAALDLAYWYGIFEDERLIGQAALHEIRRGALQSALFSMWLDAGHRGHGRAQATLAGLLELAFERLDLHRVEILTLPENRAVIEALAKMGIEGGALEPRIALVGGEWRDHLRFVIDAEDWTARREAWTAGQPA